MPSSYSVAATAADWRAALKWGSVGMESRVTNGKTTRVTLPEAHSRPTSGPP